MLCEKCNNEIKRRTTQQNSALHLFFSFVANELNEIGITYQYRGLKVQVMELRYTANIVKEFVWRPIQIAMFNKKSTTKINTQEINQIVDVITLFFAERGVSIEFPSIETLINNQKK